MLQLSNKALVKFQRNVRFLRQSLENLESSRGRTPRGEPSYCVHCITPKIGPIPTLAVICTVVPPTMLLFVFRKFK